MLVRNANPHPPLDPPLLGIYSHLPEAASAFDLYYTHMRTYNRLTAFVLD